MSAGHTPGHWEVPFLDDNRQEWVTDADGALIATMEATGNMENNARLIAAAPELLAALQALDDACCADLEDRENRITFRKALISGRAAIAKATGGAS